MFEENQKNPEFQPYGISFHPYPAALEDIEFAIVGEKGGRVFHLVEKNESPISGLDVLSIIDSLSLPDYSHEDTSSRIPGSIPLSIYDVCFLLGWIGWKDGIVAHSWYRTFLPFLQEHVEAIFQDDPENREAVLAELRALPVQDTAIEEIARLNGIQLTSSAQSHEMLVQKGLYFCPGWSLRDSIVRAELNSCSSLLTNTAYNRAYATRELYLAYHKKNEDKSPQKTEKSS